MKTPRLRAEIIATLLFWSVVSAMYGAQIWWSMTNSRMPSNVRMGPALVWTGGFYLWWGPLSLFVWWLTRKWMPAAIGWTTFLLRHVALGTAFAVVHVLLIIASATILLPAEQEAFYDMFTSQLRSRSYTELIIYAGVVGCGLAIAYYHQWRERELQTTQLEAQLASARLSTLQAQIHPHFLFNSLHAIASLARDGRNADVVKMVADLSDLLRRVTDPHDAKLPLSTEVDLAQRYLDIQRVRFGDRLRVEFNIAPDAATVLVPALTLQPLVDNAVRHGITPSVRGGTVKISAAATSSSLTLRVDDDGVGAANGSAADSGTGIANLRARLNLLFGERATLATSAGEHGGFSVTVTVPR